MSTPSPEFGTPDPLAEVAAIINAEAQRLGADAAMQAEPLRSQAQPPDSPESRALTGYFTRLSDIGALATHPDASPDEQAEMFAEVRALVAPLREVVEQFRADNPPTTILAPHERIAPSDNMHPVARAEFDQLRG